MLDRVTVGPSVDKPTEATWQAGPRSIYTGRIRQLDAESLIIVTAGEQTTTIASDRIEHVEFHWATPEAAEAMQLVAQQKYRESINPLEEAIRSGNVPRWQQRFLLAAVVRSAWALDNPRTAGILFLNLAASEPPPLHYADMPLCWTVQETPKTLRDQAQLWLASSDEVAQLLGASWLLFDAQSSNAGQVLRTLQAADNRVIARLAVAQSWRLVPPPQTMVQYPRWLEYLDALPEALQIGPAEFLADRMMRIGEVDLAIGHLARIASLHAERYDRASLALKTAKQLLEREGRSAEAERLTAWIEVLGIP